MMTRRGLGLSAIALALTTTALPAWADFWSDAGAQFQGVLAGSKLTAGGELLITARRFRTQDANREDARLRLAELIAEARVRQAKRVKTKPSKAAKARRVDAKKGRSEVKAGRGKVRID